MAARTAARSETGRVREGNEDRFIVREERGVLLMAVADGVGGGPGGEVAAEAAVSELAERFFGAPAEGTIPDRLGDAVRDANSAVLRAADASGNRSAASTLVAAAVRDGEAVIANLGDSRAYLVRDGAMRQLTEDHAGTIAHGITRFVGDPRGVQADLFVEELRPGDRLVLCSDGLTRHVADDEIATRAAGADLARAADELVALANSRGGEDNVTVILYAARPHSFLVAAPRRALGLGTFLALVVLVVAGAFAVLFSVAPATPSSTSAPASKIPASPSPSPSPSPTPSETATPSPSASPSP